MKKKNLAWIVGGGAVFAGATIFLAACSDDPKVPITGVDSGKDSTVPDSGSDAKPPGDSSVPDGSDAATCFSKLRPTPEAGPFCAFIPKGGDGGTGVNCATGQTCCYGAPKGGDAGFDDSLCIADAAAACPPPSNSAQRPGDSFECAEKDDCPTNQICCIIPLTGADGGTATLGQGTDQFKCIYMTGENGTRCRATCGTGELQGCQQDSECTGGKTCSLVNVGSGDRLQMGYCK